MEWVRLYLTVEGQTERKFAEETLRAHLASRRIDLRTRVVVTNRKLGKRGGLLGYAGIRDDLRRLMREDRRPEARFTTMVDLYALPQEFPGWVEARKRSAPAERVAELEKALEADLDDPRFLPHIQLHEFETLLYCELFQLQRRLAGSERGLGKLAEEVAGRDPEDIDEGVSTSPSKRIIHHLPAYERSKIRVGAPAASAIGLPRLRAKCPHFARWIAKLEGLSPAELTH